VGEHGLKQARDLFVAGLRDLVADRQTGQRLRQRGVVGDRDAGS
jgi:hypothetical protein